MNRNDVFQVINDERTYQDKKYHPEQLLDCGLTREQRDSDVCPHILLLEEYVEKARRAWVTTGSRRGALQQIAKVAAIAVRAIERVDVDGITAGGLR